MLIGSGDGLSDRDSAPRRARARALKDDPMCHVVDMADVPEQSPPFISQKALKSAA